jgi:membrane-bound inhibitor of C-type lysozyme
MRDRRNGKGDDRRTRTIASSASRRLGVAGAVALLTTGCTGVDVERTVYPAQLAFDCADGKTMRIARAPDGRSATVQVEGKGVTLARVDSAAEEKYSDGAFTLYLDRERAFLERDGKVAFGPCRSQAALPTAPRRNY